MLIINNLFNLNYFRAILGLKKTEIIMLKVLKHLLALELMYHYLRVLVYIKFQYLYFIFVWVFLMECISIIFDSIYKKLKCVMFLLVILPPHTLASIDILVIGIILLFPESCIFAFIIWLF